MSSVNTATWWTQGIFVSGPTPQAWLHLIEVATTNEKFDWWKEIERFGYEFIDREGDYEDYPFTLNVARHEDGHVMVEMTDFNCRLCLFFVASEDAVAFFATKYLELRKDIVAIQTGEFQRDMRRYQIAFIRHGHGVQTVDAEGWLTQDERRAIEKREEERRKAREQKQAVTH